MDIAQKLKYINKMLICCEDSKMCFGDDALDNISGGKNQASMKPHSSESLKTEESTHEGPSAMWPAW